MSGAIRYTSRCRFRDRAVRRISASDAAKIAALRAEMAELELARLQEETAQRKAQARRQNLIVATAASAVVALVLGTGVAYVSTVENVVRSPFASKQAPDDRFKETRAGIVRFGEGEGGQCRQVDFNNKSGRFSNETEVACYDPKIQDIGHRMPQAQVGDAFDGIRNSFRR
jgi:hypothetical protein